MMKNPILWSAVILIASGGLFPISSLDAMGACIHVGTTSDNNKTEQEQDKADRQKDKTEQEQDKADRQKDKAEQEHDKAEDREEGQG
jgi:hypothetical protein